MTCTRHSDLRALHAEPVRGNPPKLIGYVCPSCLALFTAHHQPSDMTVALRPKITGSPVRRNRAHAARVRAAERLGHTMRVAA